MGDAAVLYITDALADWGLCCTCGVRIGAPSGLKKSRLDDHKTFYCINGHGQVYNGKTEAERLTEELEKQKRWTESARAETARVRESRDAAERRASAARGQVTKIKNRVGNGVCPCCNRSFTNLQRHMHTKHPGYANEDASPPSPSGGEK